MHLKLNSRARCCVSSRVDCDSANRFLSSGCLSVAKSATSDRDAQFRNAKFNHFPEPVFQKKKVLKQADVNAI